VIVIGEASKTDDVINYLAIYIWSFIMKMKDSLFQKKRYWRLLGVFVVSIIVIGYVGFFISFLNRLST
jgi:hypothetical protein